MPFVGGFVCGFVSCWYLLLKFTDKLAKSVIVKVRNGGQEENSASGEKRRFFKGWKL